MSPREIFALRDYLGPDLKGRTISDARQVVSLTDILEKPVWKAVSVNSPGGRCCLRSRIN